MLMVDSLAISAIIALFILLASLVEPRGGSPISLCSGGLPKSETQYDQAVDEARRAMKKLEQASRKSQDSEDRDVLLGSAAYKACEVLRGSEVDLTDQEVREMLEAVAEAEDRLNVCSLEDVSN